MQKEIVDWFSIELFVENVSKRYSGMVNGVFGVPRGGIILATMLSYKMNIPLLLAPTRGCLIVDDIADTGITLKHWDNPRYKIATMYYKDSSIVVPDYYMRNKEDKWVEFPWEKGENESINTSIKE